ncbi:MAG: hypothetical protein ACI9SC_003182, partial [Gammaproteobacteria bacterium]
MYSREKVGITISATKNDRQIAAVIVMARSENNCPASPCRKTMGKKIATVVAVEANSAPDTCRAPCSEASCG